MGKHRILRIAAPGKAPTFREHWPSDDPYTGKDALSLDLGCTILTDDGRVTDLNAYFEANEEERGTRALGLVS